MPASGTNSPMPLPARGPWVAVALLVLAWAVLYLPAIGARSFYFEEGRRGAQALAMLETGELMKTEVFGQRYINKPPMLPWLMAATAAVRGGTLDEWSVRLPPALMTLVTTLLALALARAHSGRMAGLIAAAGVLLSVHIIQKGVTGETDTTIVAAQFAAFFVWWRSLRAGGPGILAWLACGLLLAIAMLAKGPVGAAYFCSTVLFLHLWRREWKQIGGLVLAVAVAATPLLLWTWQVYEPGSLSRWQGEMRMGTDLLPTGEAIKEQLHGAGEIIVEHMPWLLVVLVGLLIPERRKSLELETPLVGALVVYAALFSFVLMVWPHTQGRYAMPAVPAIAVLSGIAAAASWGRNRWADRALIFMIAALALYQITVAWAVPYIRGDKAYASRLAGQEITQVISEDAAPVYVPASRVHANMLVYVGPRVKAVADEKIADLNGPAWVLVPADQKADILKQLPRLGDSPIATVTSNYGAYQVYRLLQR